MFQLIVIINIAYKSKVNILNKSPGVLSLFFLTETERARMSIKHNNI